MKSLIPILKIDLNRACKRIPAMLGMLLITIVLFGAMVFGIGKVLYQGQIVAKIPIGIVSEGESTQERLLISFISSMESVKSSCRFEYLDEKSAYDKLERQEIFAMVIIPADLLEGILNGENVPAQIIFSDHGGMESQIFKEMAEAGGSLLADAQAGTYSLCSLLRVHGVDELVRETEKEVDKAYLSYALNREGMFHTETVSATGVISVSEYYMSTGMVLILLCLTVMFVPLWRTNTDFEKKLHVYGLTIAKQRLSKEIAYGSVLFLLGLIILFFIWISSIIFGWNLKVMTFFLIFAMFVVAYSVMSFAAFLCECMQGSAMTGILIFFFSLGMLFFSGGMVPYAYLPGWVSLIGQYLPTTIWLNQIRMAFAREFDIRNLCVILGVTLLFGAMTANLAKHREGGSADEKICYAFLSLFKEKSSSC